MRNYLKSRRILDMDRDLRKRKPFIPDFLHKQLNDITDSWFPEDSWEVNILFIYFISYVSTITHITKPP